MSEQSQTTKAPSDPTLCKMGCGFFGSGATGDCCSKCWIASQKKDEASVVQTPVEPASIVKAVLEKVEENSTPMDIEAVEPSEAAPQEPLPMEEQEMPAETPKKKKKKKKTSYKSMMAGMMKVDATSKDVEKEKEGLRKVTGGGAFSKIDKI